MRIWVRSSRCVILNYFITYISVNTTNKLTTIIFIVYSYMFRITRVIFRLELYLFAMSLCSFWVPRRLHVFCIDVINFIIILGCNNGIVMVLMLIIADYSRWRSLQDFSVLLVGPLFPFPVFFRWVCISWLCFRGFSPCVLVDFPGLGAAGLVCSGGRLLSRCSFHLRRGWMPPHNCKL